MHRGDKLRAFVRERRATQQDVRGIFDLREKRAWRASSRAPFWTRSLLDARARSGSAACSSRRETSGTSRGCGSALTCAPGPHGTCPLATKRCYQRAAEKGYQRHAEQIPRPLGGGSRPTQCHEPEASQSLAAPMPHSQIQPRPSAPRGSRSPPRRGPSGPSPRAPTLPRAPPPRPPCAGAIAHLRNVDTRNAEY